VRLSLAVRRRIAVFLCGFAVLAFIAARMVTRVTRSEGWDFELIIELLLASLAIFVVAMLVIPDFRAGRNKFTTPLKDPTHEPPRDRP